MLWSERIVSKKNVRATYLREIDRRGACLKWIVSQEFVLRLCKGYIDRRGCWRRCCGLNQTVSQRIFDKRIFESFTVVVLV